jgi:hypothetical protein
MVRAALDAESLGSCFGYAVRSDLGFKYLRYGGGEPLEVIEGDPEDESPGDIVREWAPPRFPVRARLHRDGSAFRLWLDQFGWMQVDPERSRITVPRAVDPVRREERIWGLPMLLCLVHRGDVTLHASCVEVEGKALVLAAPGRFGKTTLAAAFAEAGYRVLAEDLVCLRPSPNLSVIPGPAMLRVRVDVADAFRISGAAEVGRDSDRVHLALTEGRGTCAPVPLGGVALLLAADAAPRLEPVPRQQALRDLCAVTHSLPNNEDRARCFAAMGGIVTSTPVWHLSRRRRLEDLPATIECLVSAMRAPPQVDLGPQGPTHAPGEMA